MEAKTLAIQRKTTLRAIVESALRREVRPAHEMDNPDPERCEIGPFGILRLKHRPGGKPVTHEDVRRMQEECDEEDFQHALKLAGK
jgi:hypothetical protein